jgi:hypothetical protein
MEGGCIEELEELEEEYATRKLEMEDEVRFRTILSQDLGLEPARDAH